jgi:CRP-like cAMP-binding protein
VSADALSAALSGDSFTAPARSVLCGAGAPGRVVLRLSDGWAARKCVAAGGRTIIRDVHVPGDIVGLDRLLRPAPPGDEIVALTPVTGQRADAETLLEEALSGSGIRAALLERLDELRRRAEWIAAILGWGSAEERVAGFLLDLRTRLTVRGLATATGFPLPMAQQQLGAHLGLTTVHVNRVLRRLRMRDIVRVQEGTVTILDLARLQHLGRWPPA